MSEKQSLWEKWGPDGGVVIDPVNHPSHYTNGPACPHCGHTIECITITERMGFCCGNAVKYIWRKDNKGNALEDLKKARWYIDREIARMEGKRPTSKEHSQRP